MVKSIERESKGPGILFVIVVLLIVGVVAARFIWYRPATEDTAQNLPRVDVGLPGTPSGTPEARTPNEAGRPAVIIYHAHASENYSPNESHSTQGRAGDVVEVGAELARQLEAKGIKAIHLRNVNDWPRYNEAYQVAASVVQPVIQSTPNLAAVIDIHRDGLAGKPDGYTTALINGEPAAKILLVVGDLENPELDSNLAFAEQIRTGLNRLYPDLSRGLKILHTEYNGHLHPNHLTVFMGDYTDNTLEEAKRGAAALAAVLAEALKGQGTTGAGVEG
ncbi:MAG TPA: hypothetical protein GXX55_03385 [Firmicutes bacterium]|nr:hypothetical protein [Bacillota bacterium]